MTQSIFMVILRFVKSKMKKCLLVKMEMFCLFLMDLLRLVYFGKKK